MSIKEFAQKNGVVLFYSTIVLLVVVLILGFNCFGGKGRGNMGPGNFDRNQKGMMQQNSNLEKNQIDVTNQNSQEQVPDQNPEVQ